MGPIKEMTAWIHFSTSLKVEWSRDASDLHEMVCDVARSQGGEGTRGIHSPRKSEATFFIFALKTENIWV